MSAAGSSITVWWTLLLAQLREQPTRLVITVLAIALGVALGASVYLVNIAALNEFGLATKRLVGEADIVVRGPREGFSESLYGDLMRDPAVAAASPVLELSAAMPGRRDSLKIIGVDPFRAAALQPALMGDVAGGIFDLFKPNSIFISASAAEQLHLHVGDKLAVIIGSDAAALEVIGILSPATYSQSLGVMDIASAQWTFMQIGRLNRIDLRMIAGTNVERFRLQLSRRLPPGTLAIAPEVERDRAVTVTRAYRVNLNMLALVSLWTGAFLVFSTQSLSVLRRRRSLALLRALGVTRGQLQRALIGEGAVLGALGASIGIILAFVLASAMLRLLTGDLGNGQLHATGLTFGAAPLSMLSFFVTGTLVAAAGAWLPARSAARQPPARALKGGDADYAVVAKNSWRLAIALSVTGILLAVLPPIGGLPLFGYGAIACLLFGAVLLVPIVTVSILKIVPATRFVTLNTAIAQLRENVGLSTVSLASIIVSFSLMVAMAIMVYSFRESFDHWLGKLLPADMQLREPFGSDTAFWSVADQANLSAVAGVARIDFRRTRQVLLDATRPPVTLIARGPIARGPISTHGASASRTDIGVGDELPLVQSLKLPAALSGPPAWISESLQDLYKYTLGGPIDLPLGGKSRRFVVVGIWRDYARAFGAVVISRSDYIDATGDSSATEGSLWLKDRADPSKIEAGLRAIFPGNDAIEIMTTSALRERSLQIFDRAFAITYALEIIAVLIGLTGVSFAASSTALARRAEFGMLRHLGMQKRQIISLVASEGTLTSMLGVLYGLALGAVLSLVLVYVINRQSFNWSIDLDVPVWQLAVLSAALIAAAAVTAVFSGRGAMSQDAVQAVREDW